MFTFQTAFLSRFLGWVRGKEGVTHQSPRFWRRHVSSFLALVLYLGAPSWAPVPIWSPAPSSLGFWNY